MRAHRLKTIEHTGPLRMKATAHLTGFRFVDRVLIDVAEKAAEKAHFACELFGFGRKQFSTVDIMFGKTRLGAVASITKERELTLGWRFFLSTRAYRDQTLIHEFAHIVVGIDSWWTRRDAFARYDDADFLRGVVQEGLSEFAAMRYYQKTHIDVQTRTKVWNIIKAIGLIALTLPIEITTSVLRLMQKVRSQAPVYDVYSRGLRLAEAVFNAVGDEAEVCRIMTHCPPRDIPMVLDHQVYLDHLIAIGRLRIADDGFYVKGLEYL